MFLWDMEIKLSKAKKINFDILDQLFENKERLWRMLLIESRQDICDSKILLKLEGKFYQMTITIFIVWCKMLDS